MEKRVIVFLLLSLAVIFGYEYVLKELGVLPPPSTTVESPGSMADKSPSSSAVSPAIEPSSSSAGGTPSVKSAAEGVTPHGTEVVPTAAETVEVDTNLFRAKFTTRGAVITSWELKRYRDSSEEPAAVQLVRQGGKFPGPLAMTSYDTALAKELGEGLYRVEKDFTSLDQAHPDGHLTFYYEDAARGVRLEKRLTFHADSYVVDIAVKESGLDGSVNVMLGTNFGIVEWGDGFIGLIGSASLVDGKVEKETPDSESERKGAVQWAALQDKYFLSVLIPKQGSAVLVKKEGEKLVSTSVRMPVSISGSTLGLQLYAGPKEYDTLRGLQIGLEDTIDFGWFIFGSWGVVKAVAKPIFYVLRFINDYTHNYGLTIVLLTIAIKMLFVPLQYKSYKSMKQMQVIQPKVLAIQEKFKDDRDRLNKELIKLYRDHKVNPVGGCLPMVLQMPVFVALFNILYMTIDLRQAPLGLWITDLSVQDPYYVLPIVMGITMVIQQKITPTTMDPTQAKIMLMLPAFMTFLFINFPAGLVLYWLTNNTLTIGQQVVTDRFIFRNRSILSSPDEAAGKR
ncbi:MAG TPA: membrane protein insertase YidC [Nitrospiraceae bacterium]|nr:membrane protein insertase YidC [Nitrospiraceae bacterium]